MTWHANNSNSNGEIYLRTNRSTGHHRASWVSMMFLWLLTAFEYHNLQVDVGTQSSRLGSRMLTSLDIIGLTGRFLGLFPYFLDFNVAGLSSNYISGANPLSVLLAAQDEGKDQLTIKQDTTMRSCNKVIPLPIFETSPPSHKK